ncbi:hypothetical protein DERF_004310 [Dermatophagoides farinae]|uniref:Uncharacterized protein n=1 Tax=Dermatophagoides farinae TaxID=6954 RepID=A0A922I3I9_DERFA|nr:hypothetical protein DERF_004310 [Dermatophagoides farinae]
MLRGLLIFAAGVYTGIYASQNYDVPQVDKPQELLNRVKIWLNDIDRQYRKSGPSKKIFIIDF